MYSNIELPVSSTWLKKDDLIRIIKDNIKIIKML